jgi:hypothetical protein
MVESLASNPLENSITKRLKANTSKDFKLLKTISFSKFAAKIGG